jgi:hypothetical protein
LNNLIVPDQPQPAKWSPCWNTTNETIPPLAVMHRRQPSGFSEGGSFGVGASASSLYTVHMRGGDFLIDVAKCNEAAAARQNPFEFVFNGIAPIPPKSPGLCMEGFPARSLCDDGPGLSLYGQCGPQNNSWALSDDGTAFSLLSVDPSLSISDSLFAAWVSPNVAPEVASVQVYNGGTAGDVLEANADNLFSGRIRTFLNGTAATGANCWIKFVDWHDSDSGDCYAIHSKHFVGRLSGTKTSSSSTRPLYVVTQGNFECWCKADTAPISPGSTVTVSLYNDDFTDSGIDRASTLIKFIEVADTSQWCKLSREMGTYICQPWACPT